jgi:hypothetical protein
VIRKKPGCGRPVLPSASSEALGQVPGGSGLGINAEDHGSSRRTSIFRQMDAAQAEPFKKMLTGSQLYVWRGNSEIHFEVRTDSVGKVSFTYFLAITAQKVTNKFIRERVAQLGKILDEPESSRKIDETVETLTKSVDELHEQIREEGKTVGDDSHASESVIETAQEKNEIVEKLSSVYSIDHAESILSDYLISSFNMNSNLGIQHRLYSAQKKGNVFYLHDRMTFENVNLYNAEKLPEPATQQKINVDQEVFFSETVQKVTW